MSSCPSVHPETNQPISEFDQKVYQFCSNIPKGKVSTYKELAKAVGSPKAYRAVGSALRRNPFAPKVPCHRVVASDLSLGGFYGSTDPKSEDLKRKVKMLKEEGVKFAEDDEGKAKKRKISPKSVFLF